MALRDILAKFGVQVDTTKLLGFDKSVSGAIDRVKQLGAVIAGSAVVVGLSNFISDMVAAGEEIGKAAGRLGLSTDELQGWRHAVGLAGVDAKVFETSVRRLNSLAFDAGVKKSASAKEAFDRIGVSVTDQSGKLKGFTDLWLDVADGLGSVTNETERSAMATELLGRGGTAIAPFFLQGRDAIKAARDELEKFGGGLSQDTVRQLEEADDAISRFDLAWFSFKGRIVSQIIPAFNKKTEALAEFVGQAAKAIDGTDILEASLIAAAVAAGIFGKGMLLALVKSLPMIALVVIAVLLLEDTIGTLRGKDSVIKDLFDSFAGAGATERQVRRLNIAMDLLLAKDFSGAGGQILDFFASLGEDIIQHLVTPIIVGLNKIEIAFNQKFHEITASVVTWFFQLGDELLDFGGVAADKMGELAGMMVEGFISGWKDNPIISTVLDTIKGAIGGASKEAEVKSPSGKMRRFAGFLARGAELGWEEKAPGFERAVVGSVSRVVNVVGARVSQTNQISQSITGVTDPRAAGDRASGRIVGTAQDGFDSALAALVAVG